jgi:hypothetical protein
MPDCFSCCTPLPQLYVNDGVCLLYWRMGDVTQVFVFYRWLDSAQTVLRCSLSYTVIFFLNRCFTKCLPEMHDHTPTACFLHLRFYSITTQVSGMMTKTLTITRFKMAPYSIGSALLLFTIESRVQFLKQSLFLSNIGVSFLPTELFTAWLSRIVIVHGLK